MTPSQRLRCAIYTRKSSDEGLEQGFNSLHAQREACEAYVQSQAGEGWTAMKAVYDDGGFSGGSMERPGLKALLRDIDRGLIDVVVVYKVDRLTRSLGDFARIVEAFDSRSVSFVSVTQSFNTTSSMGRLTLNVLLSFAQFEREVTGERIRDKIAASKAKGMWMGGLPPLGYDPPAGPLDRALVINAAEAETVRLIFARYLELGSVHRLMDWLGQENIHSKAWVTRKGRPMGRLPFNRGALFHLLKNPTYIGRIPHRDQTYPGLHQGIVDPAIFAEVGVRLASQTVQRRTRAGKVSTMLLKGVIFDAEGCAMTPSFTQGARGRSYRYYVSSKLLVHVRDAQPDTIQRVPAPAIEAMVRDCVERISSGTVDDIDGVIRARVARVEVHPSSLQIVLRRKLFFKQSGEPQSEFEVLAKRLRPTERISQDAAGSDIARVTIPCRLKTQGGRIRITLADGREGVSRTNPDLPLIAKLRWAHQHLARESGTALGRVEDAIPATAPVSAYDRDLCRLAFLAPDIQILILEGRQPAGLTLASLFRKSLPPAWQDQRRMLGITL